MNTTKLIHEWSMAGAGRDVGGRFRSGNELRTTFGREETPTPAATSSFLMKPAGGHEWQPLTVGTGGGDGERA